MTKVHKNDLRRALVQATPETQIELAPAAGSGIGKLLAAALLAKPDLIEGMVAVIDRGFNANKRFWDANTKSWDIEPDGRTQIQTLALVLAHMEGEPVKRIIHQHLGGAGAMDVHAALRESPALRDSMRRELEKAEFRTRKVKKAEAIELE